VPAKERYHGGIEFLVEDRAVEIPGVDADIRQGLRRFGRTRGDEGEMRRVGHHAILRLRRQIFVDRVTVFRQHAIAAALRRPELDRHLHVLQSLEGEGAAELRVGQNGGGEAWIRGRPPSGNMTLVDLGTHSVDEAFGAERGDPKDVEPAARDHEASIGAA
jgi:hypothetical protein